MEYEPRLDIHMEKQFGWAHNLGAPEYLVISKAGQIVLALLMESQMWHQIAGFVTLSGEGLEKGMASAGLDARHFGFS